MVTNASKEALVSYHWFSKSDFITNPEGEEGVLAKTRSRQFSVEMSNERIIRKDNRFQYSAYVTETEHTPEGNTTRQFYIYRIYKWDKWKYSLTGIGNTGDLHPGNRLENDY